MHTYTGFSLFRTRILGEKIDTKTFEHSSGILLPPIYQLFVASFQMSRELLGYENWDESEQKTVGFSLFTHVEHRDHFVGCEFYPLEETIEVMRNAYNEDDEIWDAGLLTIADNGMNQFVLLGTSPENKDKIFLERSDLTPRLIPLADNIFEFIRGFELKPSEQDLGGIKLQQLYRNWGEDFWRVRTESRE